jgi:hypothetical protein
MGQKRQRHGDFDRLKHEENSDFTNFTEDMDVSRAVFAYYLGKFHHDRSLFSRSLEIMVSKGKHPQDSLISG